VPATQLEFRLSNCETGEHVINWDSSLANLNREPAPIEPQMASIVNPLYTPALGVYHSISEGESLLENYSEASRSRYVLNRQRRLCSTTSAATRWPYLLVGVQVFRKARAVAELISKVKKSKLSGHNDLKLPSMYLNVDPGFLV